MKAEPSKCPICGRPAAPHGPYYPFCGERCRTQDLANWATGTYAIPAPASEADENLEPPDRLGESEGHG